MNAGIWNDVATPKVQTEAKKYADEVLSLLWSNAGFPVDPVAIARKMEIVVVETELPGDVSGALIKEPGKDPEVFIHITDSRQRKRFSCAHELGHYFSRLRTLREENQYEYVDFRDANSSLGSNKEEIFANAFAANLLMPEQEVRKQYGRKSNFWLATYFDVSETALAYRIENLKLPRNVG